MKKQFLFVLLMVTACLSENSPSNAYDNWYGHAAGYGAAGAYGGYGGYGGNAGYGGYGGYGGIGYGGAAGGVGSIATGMGNLVQAEGQRNVLNSQAAIGYQQAWQENEKARQLHIETQDKIHYDVLKRKRESQAQDAQDREAARASREHAQQFLDAHRPQPLSASQLDLAKATVTWPIALKSSDFDSLRATTENLLQERGKYGANPESTRQLTLAAGAMKDILRSQILKVPGSDYSSARKFLDSMAASFQ